MALMKSVCTRPATSDEEERVVRRTLSVSMVTREFFVPIRLAGPNPPGQNGCPVKAAPSPGQLRIRCTGTAMDPQRTSRSKDEMDAFESGRQFPERIIYEKLVTLVDRRGPHAHRDQL